ncbi:LOW QUALITY PROTEIN: hypothetical protein U9M48_004637 [Paspalum notatum var. saurae]|uniref:NB-ARC domain-containing protein n=1 Tax=Paspalum notatum var. saurae TaxID=547442 RepID=A0AAQ3SJ83_PASNO
MMKRVKHVKIWHRLALQLRQINAELEDTTKRRQRYVTPLMGSSNQHAISTNGTVLCLAREEDLVGVEEIATTLKGWLVNDLKERNTKITTVWGMGGVGKTTLVDHVYKIVKLDFDAAAWVTVSKSYQVEDMLRKIATEFGILDDATHMEIRSIVDIIRNHLEGYLFGDILVFKLSYPPAGGVFPTNSTSRFVLTSRMFEVASLATSNCTIKLEPLGLEHSWKLFCKVAFRNSDGRCPSELQDLGVQFLHKCQGLPIAIACIGRVLSFKNPTYAEWNEVYKELELQSTNNVIQSVDIILKVSLEDLPCELKNCFLHCAIFPEDYEMSRRTLIRHWITSGFIKEKESKTLEQVAGDYDLNDLVNRILLQVVTRNASGRVKNCRMHDVIRQLAVEKAAKEGFGKVYEDHGTLSENNGTHSRCQYRAPTKYSARHLRAIYAFTSFVDIDLLRHILASSVLLAALDLRGTQIKMLPNEVFSLFNLRFLGLRDTRIEILPEAIGRLTNLEVLDAARTCLLSLPKNIVKLNRLRHLYATVAVTQDHITCYRGVKLPRGMRNLTGLHILQAVTASSETLCDVAALKELRKISIDHVTSEYSLNLRSALVNMINLVNLVISTSNKNEVLPLEELQLPKTLCKLALIGQLEKKREPHILSSWLHLNNLTSLCLTFSKLDENSFPSVMVLQSLCFLAIFQAYDGKTLCFPAQSFPRLRELEIWGAPQLNQVVIEEDALGSLVSLSLGVCPQLNLLPHGIEYLTVLDKLSLVNTTDELIDMLNQEPDEANECKAELMKISHIREFLNFKLYALVQR